jgi:hypothetical protein
MRPLKRNTFNNTRKDINNSLEIQRSSSIVPSVPLSTIVQARRRKVEQKNEEIGRRIGTGWEKGRRGQRGGAEDEDDEGEENRRK